jgi:hypothetical protein
MAKPSTRQELIDYCKRQLGYPVLEINIADEQISDLVDDAIQMYNERHFDGVSQIYLKYEVTQDDVDRGKARPPGAPNAGSSVGIASTSATTTIVGTATTFTYYENSNYLQVPPDIIGINKVFQYDDAQSVNSTNMFSFKYQLFLNDVYYWGTTDLLTYSMSMSYLETINFLLNTHKQIRFNQKQDRMYLDVDWSNLRAGEYLIIDCWRQMDGNDFNKVWNDRFVKKYLTALMKRQWGMNLIKFQGVKLPGGVELNGRQIYDDGQKEIDDIIQEMPTTYELPPLDMIG